MRTIFPAACLLAGLTILSMPAHAADLPGTGLNVDGEAILMSDYRFRGISRSDEDPALQGSLTLSTDSGFYLGGRGTTLHHAGALGGGELDLYAGYGANLGLGTSLDAGVLYYYFPDGKGDTDYVEPYASLSHQLGPVLGTAGVKYAPKQDALGGKDSLYAFGQLEAGIPTTPLTLTAEAGHQDLGAFGDYWTWSLGARAVIGPVNAGIRYVDTDLPALPNQDAGLVLSVGVRF